MDTNEAKLLLKLSEAVLFLLEEQGCVTNDMINLVADISECNKKLKLKHWREFGEQS